MGCIECLVAENSINREKFHWPEFLVMCHVVEHLCTNGSCVRSQNVLHGLFLAPAWTIAMGFFCWKTIFMSLTHCFTVFFWNSIGIDWVFEEESIVSIARWMSLRLEKSVEIPERTLNEPVSWHLVETHLRKNLPELSSDFQ